VAALIHQKTGAEVEVRPGARREFSVGT